MTVRCTGEVEATVTRCQAGWLLRISTPEKRPAFVTGMGSAGRRVVYGSNDAWTVELVPDGDELRSTIEFESLDRYQASILYVEPEALSAS